MTPTTPELCKSNLKGPVDRHLITSARFIAHGCAYSVRFGDDQDGLSTFLDFFESEGSSDHTSFLHIRPQGIDFPSASLRFSFNREHRVAAALMVAADRNLNEYCWMTRGKAGLDDVVLLQDSSVYDSRFPLDSFITTAELREVITQWVFGDALPPPAVDWVAVPDVRWF